MAHIIHVVSVPVYLSVAEEWTSKFVIEGVDVRMVLPNFLNLNFCIFSLVHYLVKYITFSIFYFYVFFLET